MYKAICFGEILWDNLPGGKVPGGAPMNIFLHMHNFGMNAALISRLGKDEAGDELVKFLEDQEVSTKFIQRDEKLETGSVDVVMGEPEGLFFRIAEPAAWDNIKLNDQIIEAVNSAKMFVFGSLAARTEQTRKTLFELLEHANRKVFSVNLRPPHYTWSLVETLLKESDIVKLTESEYKELLDWCGKGYYLGKEGLEYLRSKFDLDTICVTLGRKGAMMNRRGEFYARPGYEVEIIDKVGCGNAFLSAYLYARAEKKEPLERLTYAIAAGAIVATFKGAVPKITPDMINEFIESARIIEV
ncbi:MAG: carbohydrate kinase [Bacteroidetes bacterium]|nr:carbohydrate kinase [Bacteroidota bacterium]